MFAHDTKVTIVSILGRAERKNVERWFRGLWLLNKSSGACCRGAIMANGIRMVDFRHGDVSNCRNLSDTQCNILSTHDLSQYGPNVPNISLLPLE